MNENSYNEDNKFSFIAETFIQNFPFMTFKEAHEKFLKLDPQTIHPLVWQKIDHMEHDTNKIIKLALHMIFLPKELQYRILNESYRFPQNLNEIMNEKSIYEHFWWRSMIDKKWKSNQLKNYLTIIPSKNNKCYRLCTCDRHPSEIELTQQELFILNYEKIEVIRKIEHHHLNKKELLLFCSLQNTLQNRFNKSFCICSHYERWNITKGKWYYDYKEVKHYNYTVKFHYRKRLIIATLIRASFKSCIYWLPRIVPTLLFTHFYTEQLKSMWTYAQDPSLLEKNREKELINTLIDNLKESLVPGSKLLKKEIIKPIPFEWKISPENNSAERLLLLAFYNNIFFLKYCYNYIHTSTENGSLLIALCLAAFSTIRTLFLETFLVPHLCTITRPLFAYGVPIGLTIITIAASVHGIIKRIIKSYILKKKFIDFNEDKFKNKSIKEVIEYYLNKSSIEII